MESNDLDGLRGLNSIVCPSISYHPMIPHLGSQEPIPAAPLHGHINNSPQDQHIDTKNTFTLMGN